MRKFLTPALVAVMLFVLSACGGEPVVSETQPAAAAPIVTEPVVTPLEMDETTLVDDENCAFSVRFASENEHLGMTLEAVCTNKTESSMIFSWNSVSVCGWLYDPQWSQEVGPGESVSSTVYIDTFQLEQYGVATVEEIVFTLYVFDSVDFMAEPYVNSAFTIYPTGLDAASVAYPERVSAEGEQVMADNESLTFIIEALEGGTLEVYLENKTEKSLLFSWEDTALNGVPMDPMWAMELPAGTRAKSSVTFDLTQADIGDLEEVSFRLLVTDALDWEAQPTMDEVFTYLP